MLAQSSHDVHITHETMLETTALRLQAQQWWQIVCPYADRCFEFINTVAEYRETPESRLAFLRELHDHIDTITALPCPIPLTTARRQLMDALDEIAAGFDSHATGQFEVASAHNRAAMRHLYELARTLDAFGVGA